MKFALTLLAFVATSTAVPWKIPNVGRGVLANELQDFLDLLPQEEVASITQKYYTQDVEFYVMVQYVKSDGFKQLVKYVQDLPEMKALMKYLYKAGVDVYKLQDLLNNWLGLTQTNFAIDKQLKHIGGIRGYVDDVRAAIRPVKDQLINLYRYKMQNSQVFQDFVTQLKSPNFQHLVNKIYVHPQFQRLLKRAAHANIDFELIKDLLKIILGIDVPSYSIFQC